MPDTNKTINSHRLTKDVKFANKVVIFWQGKVLLLQRSSLEKTRPLKWDLPGGNSEWPTDMDEPIENPHEDDIVREIFEETGLIVDPENFVDARPVYLDTYFDNKTYAIRAGWRLVLETPEEPKITISEEHDQFVWINPEQRHNYDYGYGIFIPKMIEAATG